MKLLAHALLAAILSGAAAASAAVPACDDGRAVETVKAHAAREQLDVSMLQLVVEGPYRPAKFARTHPTFPPSPAVKRKLARRTFWFVWFHPPFGTRGADLWALVDAGKCDLLHLARGR